MKQEHVLSILYELALITSGETQPASLISRFLQRLMFHTGMPLGLCLDEVEASPEDGTLCVARLAYAIGDPALAGRSGQQLLLPAELVRGESATTENAALLAAGLGQYGAWRSGLRLRIDKNSVFLLLSTEPLQHEIPWPAVFHPVLDNFSHVLTLCRRNAEQTAALAATNRELEAFSYSISHDLRAPLRAIDGFARALAEDYAGSLDDTARDYISRISAGAQRMGMLIDDLLQLSRVNRAALQPVEVDLRTMAAEITDALRAGSPGRQVEVVIAPCISAHGDDRLLHIVLTNLFDNAWKYTNKTEAARIEFGTFTQDSETVYYLRDNGTGFDMQFAGKLFGAFQRLHGAEFPGTGIGLATVQRIIHRHGGRVWAEAEPDKGATFFFTLGAKVAG